ncbi:MAG: polysaccharide biosynthesis tyrosine autokinase [Clostridiales bacterium]|nr:polysaccharide biosynthesis tyrosine autokinase [Clostridiales bacterium]
MNEWLEYTDNNQYVIRLDQLVKLLLRNIWIIILCTILLGGACYTYSAFCITPLYRSSIKMYVNNTTNTNDTTSISSSDITASQYLVETYAVVLSSKPTLEGVIEQTGVDYTYEELSDMISTTAINETEVFCVTVTSPDPVEAAEIANAIAEVAPDEIGEIVSGSSVKVVEYASVATSKSSPNNTKNALIGALIGFILSCVGIMISSLLRNGMSVEEKIRKDFKDAAVLSVIPLMGKKSKGKHKKGKELNERADLCDRLNFASSEAYKLLRENISFCLSDVSSCRLIGVTSSARAEGKSTTSINLAYTLALTKKRVCLIDCDFRLPSIAKTLAVSRKPGMTNLLAAPSAVANVLQKYETDAGSFYVISAGDIPPNPSELLGSKRMQSTLEVLEKYFDYIVLDLPPVGVVSDALTVSKMVDGMLFVVREDFYDRRVLRESMRMLEGVDTKLLGMVVTRSTTQEKEYKRYGDKYGYQYGYSYGYGSADNKHSYKEEKESEA